jgi:hypothetical protein
MKTSFSSSMDVTNTRDTDKMPLKVLYKYPKSNSKCLHFFFEIPSKEETVSAFKLLSDDKYERSPLHYINRNECPYMSLLCQSTKWQCDSMTVLQRDEQTRANINVPIPYS